MVIKRQASFEIRKVAITAINRDERKKTAAEIFETDLLIASRIHSLHKKKFKKDIFIDTTQRTLTRA
jgi:hypothetical protein